VAGNHELQQSDIVVTLASDTVGKHASSCNSCADGRSATRCILLTLYQTFDGLEPVASHCLSSPLNSIPGGPPASGAQQDMRENYNIEVAELLVVMQGWCTNSYNMLICLQGLWSCSYLALPA
jgi:hypothetical protein